MTGTGGSDNQATWRRLARGDLSWETFRARALVLSRIREFFRDRGFLEVDTPVAAPHPNIDPNIFPVTVSDPSGRTSRLFLHTSPEIAMKKLLAAGSGDIFHVGKVFRDREGSPLHHPEFTMLEWYRVDGTPEAVMADAEALVRTLAREIRGEEAIRRGGRTVPLSGPWPRWELGAAFASLLDAPPGDAPALRSALAAKGHRPGADEAWEDLFFRAYVDVVEPALADKGACFLTGYPAPLAAMAKRRAEDGETAERFEGYIDGIEIVNGYEELTDPEEQERRLRALASRHEARTGIPLSVDPDFIASLRHGLPPASGAALGVDRLVMLLLGKDSLGDVIYR
jgi:elongation factor P--(R)-beta-lysine ligase